MSDINQDYNNAKYLASDIEPKNNRKIKIFLCISSIALFFVVSFTIFIFIFGINTLGWFDNYEGMYKTELPIEYPAKGGTLYLPNNWEFKEDSDWYSIVDKESGITVAYEAYHGYERFIKGPSNYEWVNYEINPNVNQYNYDKLEFDYITNSSNNCTIVKAEDLYGIYFMDTCYFKDRKYSRIYIFAIRVELKTLKRIDNSYSWGGEIKID